MCEGSAGVMRQHGGRGASASAIPLAALSVLRGPGVPLDPVLHNFMAPRFGCDFSAVPTGQATVPLAIARDDDPLEAAADRVAERALNGSIISGPAADLRRVRIHADSLAAAAAQSVGARAFAVGDHVVFGAGQYRPDTADGRRLLAHELAHVGQRGGGAMLYRKPLPGEPGGLAEPMEAAPGDEDENRQAQPAGALATAVAGQTQPDAMRPGPNASVRGVARTTVPSPVAPPGVEPQPAAEQEPKSVGDLPTSAIALIDEELAEHERWGAAVAQVGTAGSEQRAEFIAERMGSGAGSGLVSGAKEGAAQAAAMHAAMKVAEKVVETVGSKVVVRLGTQAVKFTPLPGLGAMVGGYMAVVDLIKNREATAKAIAGFGSGSDIYEQLANSIEAISAVIQTQTQVANIIAGVLGAITVIMWAVAVATAGAVSPVALTLTTIALEIGAATMVIDAINSLVLKDLASTFRALHAFASDADPRDVAAQGDEIEKGAQGVGGFVGGYLGGKGVEAGAKGLHYAAGKLGERLPSRPEPPAATGEGPRVKAEPPAAPTAEASAAGAGISPVAPKPTQPFAPPPEAAGLAAEPAPAPASKPPGAIGATAVPEPAPAAQPPAAPGPAPPAATTPTVATGSSTGTTTTTTTTEASSPAAGAVQPAGTAQSASSAPQQLSLPGVDTQATASPITPPAAQAATPPATLAPPPRTGLRPLTPILELRGINPGERVPQGLEPGAIGTYGRAVANPHQFAIESNPPGAPGTTAGGGRMPQQGRAQAQVYGEHQTPAAVAHEVLQGHEYHGPQGQRRGGRDTLEALAISFPEAAKPVKDRLDAQLLSEVRARKARGEEVPPIEAIVRGAQHSQIATARPGVNVPGQQVTKSFLGEVEQFHDPRFGYTEMRAGEASSVPSPLQGVSQAEIDAHIDALFDPHIAASPRLPTPAAVPASTQLELSFDRSAAAVTTSPTANAAADVPAVMTPPAAAAAATPVSATEATPQITSPASRPGTPAETSTGVRIDIGATQHPPAVPGEQPSPGGETAAPPRRLRVVDGNLVDLDGPPVSKPDTSGCGFPPSRTGTVPPRPRWQPKGRPPRRPKPVTSRRAASRCGQRHRQPHLRRSRRRGHPLPPM
jgi:hypothetical protein